MKFDFSVPISAYELIAIILGVIALLVPIIQWAINKWIKKLKLSFLPSGVITLYQNKSGSYISLGGVYNAENKSTIITEVSADVIRKADSAALPQIWSSFSSPVVKKVVGGYESSFETAHPFKVNANTLEPTFIEFCYRGQNMEEKINSILNPVITTARTILSAPDISIASADAMVKTSPAANAARIKLNDDFFWKVGEYELRLTTKNGKTQLVNCFSFSLSQDESDRLRENIESMLVLPVAEHYRATITFNTVRKEFKEKA